MVKALKPLRKIEGLPAASEVNLPCLVESIIYYDHVSIPKTASSKTRGQVAGGGAKPYRQKGTGRARQGSIRAPHYRGGGIVFGPHPLKRRVKVNRRIRQTAFSSALRTKLDEGKVYLLPKESESISRTKEFAELLRRSEISGRSLFLHCREETIHRAVSNLSGVRHIDVSRARASEIAFSGNVILTPRSLEIIEKRLAAV